MNILNNDGIVKGSKDTYKRFTGQINADYDIYKWLNVTTNTSFEKYKTKGVTRGYGSLLNSVVSIDPLTPAYISNVEDLAPGMKAQVEAGGPVPRDPSHNNDYYGTSKYVDDATGNPLISATVMTHGLLVSMYVVPLLPISSHSRALHLLLA